MSPEDTTNQDSKPPLSASKRLLRSLSERLRVRNSKTEGGSYEEDDGVSLRHLTLHGRGGGSCKVSADTGDKFGDAGSSLRQLNASKEEREIYSAAIHRNEEATINCFSYGLKEAFWRRNRSNQQLFKQKCSSVNVNVHLPDDILELCLVRLPLTSLMIARLVCKKWRTLTTTPTFLQMRRDRPFQTPWLFLFGTVKDRCCSGEVHAYDVSQNQWHKIYSENLRGRFLYSVTCIQDEVYIVGGCSSLTNLERANETHKGVLVFNPMSKTTREIASMNHARSSPVLGAVHIPNCMIVRNQQNRSERHSCRSRISDVYLDPHGFSIRQQSGQLTNENDSSADPNAKPYKYLRQENEIRHGKCGCAVIAVGGLGCWQESLDSGEIYDPMLDKWTEIQRLPQDFGGACSGVVCNRMFYVYSDSDKLARYDIEKGYWVILQTSPWPTRLHEYHPNLVLCKGRVLMLCVSWCEGVGRIGRRNKAVRKLWELDVKYHTWNEVSVHPDAPMDWNAAFVAYDDLIFGVEMFRIFGQALDFVTMFNMSDPRKVWRHISRNHVGRHVDAASCMTKSIAVAVLRL